MLDPDKPYLNVPLGGSAEMECCYTSAETLTATWVVNVLRNLTVHTHVVKSSELVTVRSRMRASVCSVLLLKSAQLSDIGLYQCLLNTSDVHLFSHGTFLHVYSKGSETGPAVSQAERYWERRRHGSSKHC